MSLFAVSLELHQPTSNYFVNPLNRISIEGKKKRKTKQTTKTLSAVPTRCSQNISRQTFTDCKLVQQPIQPTQSLKSLCLFKGLPTATNGERENLILLHPKLFSTSSRGRLTALIKYPRGCFFQILCKMLCPSVHLHLPCSDWKAGCHTAKPVWSLDSLR